MTEKTDALYRIMDYHHVVQLFKTKKLYFSHPSRWEDPYEKRLKHPISQMLYAHCWCTKSMSDAMWRIFSKNQTSIRIRTTRFKLFEVMHDFCKASNKQYKRRVTPLTYLTTPRLEKKTLELVKVLREADEKDAISAAADIICMKRNAFDHEAEVRAILYCPSESGEEAKAAVLVDVDPHDFVESILIDPRASDEITDTIAHYFKTVLNYRGSIARSTLYQVPSEIAADAEEVVNGSEL